MIPKFCSCVGDVGEDGAGGRVAGGGGGVYLCAYCQLSRAVTSITLLHRSSSGLDTVLYMCHPVGRRHSGGDDM